MKKKLLMALAGVVCAGLVTVTAADKDGHKHAGTPKGGRLLEKTEPHAEFVVEKDHTASINFYTEDMKPVAASTQTVTITADAKDGKKKIDFEKKGDSLVSTSKLPDGDGYNLVVQFKQNPTAKPQNFRVKLDLATCGECKRAEYACICEH